MGSIGRLRGSQPSTFPIWIRPEASSAQSSIGMASRQGSTVWLLIQRALAGWRDQRRAGDVSGHGDVGRRVHPLLRSRHASVRSVPLTDQTHAPPVLHQQPIQRLIGRHQQIAHIDAGEQRSQSLSPASEAVLIALARGLVEHEFDLVPAFLVDEPGLTEMPRRWEKMVSSRVGSVSGR